MIKALLQNKNSTATNTTRRTFVKGGLAALAAFVIAPKTALASKGATAKHLNLCSIHTGEKLSVTFWKNGSYIPEALNKINHLLRDHRTGDVHPIDTKLLDLLFDIRCEVGTEEPFMVISGYRSPKTNAMLNGKSNGVAKKSLHMQGRAIDIRIPGCKLSNLRQCALKLSQGGVGFYSKSNFVHVDTGRVRTWGA